MTAKVCFNFGFKLKFSTEVRSYNEVNLNNTVLNCSYQMHLDRQLRLNCCRSFGFKPKPLYFPLRPSAKIYMK